MTAYAPALAAYLDWMRTKGHTVLTVTMQTRRLAKLGRFLAAAEIVAIEGITSESLQNYVRHLQETPIHRGRGSREKRRRQTNYLRRELMLIAGFFRYLAEHEKIADPFAGVKLPTTTLLVSQNVLTEDEAARLLNAPPVDQAQGLRDRVLLELAYSAGLWPWEMVPLDVADVDLAGERVTIRAAGPRPERTVAVGASAVFWLRRYLAEARPVQLRAARDRALFLNYSGERLELKGFFLVLRRAVRQARLGRRVVWGTLRHGCAARRLRDGADAAEVRALLSHRR